MLIFTKGFFVTLLIMRHCEILLLPLFGEAESPFLNRISFRIYSEYILVWLFSTFCINFLPQSKELASTSDFVVFTLPFHARVAWGDIHLMFKKTSNMIQVSLKIHATLLWRIQNIFIWNNQNIQNIILGPRLVKILLKYCIRSSCPADGKE